MWVYLEDASDADRALIVLERKIGTGDTGAYNRTARPQAQTGWQRVELAGEAMSELCTEQVIKFEVAAGNAGAVYFDDAFVYTEAPESINWLRNPAFEDGNNAWSSYSTVDGGRSGRAVRLEAGSETLQASGWWGAGRPTYAGEQAMTLSVWAKSESGRAGCSYARNCWGNKTTARNLTCRRGTFGGSTPWRCPRRRA